MTCILKARKDKQLATTTRSHDEVMSDFRRGGTTVADWSRDHGFSPALVYVVLRGHRKCLRGKSHEIAIALGIK